MKNDIRPLAVAIKAIGLFVLINLVYALIQPPVGRLSLYTVLFPGRERLPFGDALNPFALSIDNIDAMFESHAIGRVKKQDEIRVAVIGDSSVWGENLNPDDSLTGQWNRLDLRCGEKTMRVYNLGYPHPSVVKDLLFLQEVTRYDPDVVVWLITLNTLSSLRVNPVLTENREKALGILDTYHVTFPEEETLRQSGKSLYDRTIVGQRSYLARLIKLQALGWLWSATNHDVTEIPEPAAVSQDVSDDLNYKKLPPGSDLRSIMLVDALSVGHELVAGIPILLVNEPIFVAGGRNSDVRYNDFYPRWAYDQYRDVISTAARQESWNYLDLWNILSPGHFTDTALHLDAGGERLLAERLQAGVRSLACH